MKNEQAQYSRILGIDLGTTNSVITVWDGSKQEYIPIPSLRGSSIVPSAVSIIEGTIKVGETAREELKLHPANTILSVKSHMDNPKHRFHIENALTSGGDADFSPVEITTNILKYIKKSAENYIGEDIKDVVITVPAYYREIERQMTRRAAENADLNVIEIINEPTAACLAYGYANKKEEDEKKILVYDLGGGTFDVTLLSMDPDFYEVIDTDGDKIGGDNLDLAFLEYIKKKASIGNATISQAKMLVEEAKIILSKETKVTVDFSGYGGESIEVTRRQFENTVLPLIQQTTVKIESLLELHGKDIDEVVLVGGSTKNPIVRKELMKILQLPKDYYNNYEEHPDIAVSIGACIRGRILLGETDIVLVDKTPFNLGVELNNGKLDALIHRGSVIPTKGSDIYQNELGVQEATFNIYQGNSMIASNNQYLGEITFPVDTTMLPILNFKVEFNLDSSGLLTVIVQNTFTGEIKEVEVKGVTN